MARYDRSALDALPELTTDGPVWRQLGLLIAGGVVAVLVAAGVVREVLSPPGRGPELVEPLAPDIWTAAIFVGTFLGVLAAWLIWVWWRHDDDGEGSTLDLIVGIGTALTLCVASTTWCARSLVGAMAFAGWQAATAVEPFTVVGVRENDEGGGWLRLRQGAGGRAFGYAAGSSVVRTAHPGDTVLLPVETGRWHIRRTRPGAVLAVADLRRP